MSGTKKESSLGKRSATSGSNKVAPSKKKKTEKPLSELTDLPEDAEFASDLSQKPNPKKKTPSKKPQEPRGTKKSDTSNQKSSETDKNHEQQTEDEVPENEDRQEEKKKTPKKKRRTLKKTNLISRPALALQIKETYNQFAYDNDLKPEQQKGVNISQNAKLLIQSAIQSFSEHAVQSIIDITIKSGKKTVSDKDVDFFAKTSGMGNLGIVQ